DRCEHGVAEPSLAERQGRTHRAMSNAETDRGLPSHFTAPSHLGARSPGCEEGVSRSVLLCGWLRRGAEEQVFSTGPGFEGHRSEPGAAERRELGAAFLAEIVLLEGVG